VQHATARRTKEPTECGICRMRCSMQCNSCGSGGGGDGRVTCNITFGACDCLLQERADQHGPKPRWRRRRGFIRRRQQAARAEAHRVGVGRGARTSHVGCRTLFNDCASHIVCCMHASCHPYARCP
jgi:hypothetical protein